MRCDIPGEMISKKPKGKTGNMDLRLTNINTITEVHGCISEVKQLERRGKMGIVAHDCNSSYVGS
jgi:hypothetical protein